MKRLVEMNDRKKTEKKKMTWLKGVAIFVGAVLLVVVLYLLYVIVTYSRIEDGLELQIQGKTDGFVAERQKEYTITSYNVGFGAYTRDFTFFMDGGKQSRAKSAQSVTDCTNGAVDVLLEYDPDIFLFQEMDTDSTRSHHIDQSELVLQRLEGYEEAFAQNYHSAYLMVPLTCPHGASNSGVATFSRLDMKTALRRQLPIAKDLSKLIDLDRCYSRTIIPMDDGTNLVIYNVHLSAYGADASVKEAQFSLLFEDMSQQYKQGNYVVCGGDFNSDFIGDSNQQLNGDNTKDAGWTQPFPDQLIPDGIIKCTSYEGEKVLPTARDCDIPYQEGNFTIMVDGFLVSDNVEVTYLENVQTGFTYSDHNPVCMRFKLK